MSDQLPEAFAPPAPAGTRNVTLNTSSQTAGDFATLRNLTLNSNVGQVAIPPGTYGSFSANGNSGFVLGVAGSAVPAVYNLQGLTLNSSSTVQIVGPVILTVANSVAFNGVAGNSTHPEWLVLQISSGGVTLNTGSTVYANVFAPNGTVTINSALFGVVSSDRLTINSNGALTQPTP